MDIPAIDVQVLTRRVPRSGRQEKNYRCGDLLRRSHSFLQKNFGYEALTLFFGVRKACKPMLIKRSHYFRRDDCVDPYAVRQQVGSPLPRQRESRALRGHITRGISLSGDCRLGADIDDRPSGLFQVWERVMSHVVIVQQVSLERGDKLIGIPGLQTNFVVDPRVVYQCIQPSMQSGGLSHRISTVLRIRQLEGEKYRSSSLRRQLGLQLLSRSFVPVHNDRDGAFLSTGFRDSRTDTLRAARYDHNFITALQI